MGDIQDITGDLFQLFSKYKEKQKIGMLCAFNNVKTCYCGHNARIQSVKRKTGCSKFWRILLILFIILLYALIGYTYWAVSSYNIAQCYGNGGCLSSYFWTCKSCEVVS